MSKVQRCENCRKKSEELYAMWFQEGNEDSRFLCERCFIKIHKQPFEEVSDDTRRITTELCPD